MELEIKRTRFTREGHFCCSRLDRGVVRIVEVGYIIDHYCSKLKDRGVVLFVVDGHNVGHYCLNGYVPLNCFFSYIIMSLWEK
jgi:hypothetical protein